MITRQRANLNRTFAEPHSQALESSTAGRLSKAEAELAAAAAEFARGVESKFGPVPALSAAVEAMLAATQSLIAREVAPSLDKQTEALAALVKARQNLRQMLSPQSPNAQACRKFDRQQKNKLKPPPSKEPPSLAKLAEQLRELAQDQESFCENAGGATGQAANQAMGQPSSSAADKSKSTPSPEALVERQDKAAQRAGELAQTTASDERLTPLAHERLDAAADQVGAAAENARAGDLVTASQEAGQAASSLRELADQVAALTAPGLTAQLDQLGKLADQASRGQAELAQQAKSKAGDAPPPGSAAGSSPASAPSDQPGSSSQGVAAAQQSLAAAQQGLAERARTLDDVLGRLATGAAEIDRELGQGLAQARERHDPAAWAERLNLAAEDLAGNRLADAAQVMQDGAAGLAELSQDIQAARQHSSQARLAELLTAERKAAAARESVAQSTAAAETGEAAPARAAAEQQVRDLERELSRLSETSPPLAAAQAELAEATLRGGFSPVEPAEQPLDDRPTMVQTHYAQTLAVVAATLQSEIQKLLLEAAQSSGDELVPPQFRAQIEDYYRVLSEDLR